MNKLKWITLGLTIGMISMLIFLPLVLKVVSWKYGVDFSFIWKQFCNDAKYTSKYLSLACIPNLIWFYIFLNKEKYDIARGIIIATLILVPYSIYVNFL
jgi:hypothetical protein